MGVRTVAAAGAAGILCAMPQGKRPPVEVRTLGGFLLLRDGQPVPPSEWQSKKARDLLKILLARRGRPTPRELLMEALWPGENPEPLANRLSVALARARTVLDPLRKGASDHFIGGDPTSVWLEQDELHVDVEVFLAEASAGMAMLDQGRDWEARELLDAAEAKYAGDFLEEDLYEEWTTGLREEARAIYISVAHALARIARQADDHDAAVRYLLRVLQRDPHDEEAHLGLVSALSSAGRHGEARRSYGFYVARMEELGMEPAPMPLGTPP
jgi:DNA-binding SARP family transcriptional activator